MAVKAPGPETGKNRTGDLRLGGLKAGLQYPLSCHPPPRIRQHESPGGPRPKGPGSPPRRLYKRHNVA